jgi:hypothetical protein
MEPKQLLRVLVLLFSFVSFATCVAAVIGLLVVGPRLSAATQDIFRTVNDALAVVREKVERSHDRVIDSKITAESIEESVKKWSRQEAGERLAEQLEVEKNAAQLATVLVQADQWLELSESSAVIAKHAMSAVGTTTAQDYQVSIESLIEQIAALRVQVANATAAVGSIRERAAGYDSETPSDQRIDAVLQLARRLFVTLGSIDTRLADFAHALSGTQRDLRQMELTTVRWILIARIGFSLLVAWLAAGQVCLLVHAWRGLTRSERGTIGPSQALE